MHRDIWLCNQYSIYTASTGKSKVAHSQHPHSLEPLAQLNNQLKISSAITPIIKYKNITQGIRNHKQVIQSQPKIEMIMDNGDVFMKLIRCIFYIYVETHTLYNHRHTLVRMIICTILNLGISRSIIFTLCICFP